MSSHLIEIAKQKKQEWLNLRKNSHSERKNWAKKVEELYKQIIEWSKPLEEEGIISFQFLPWERTEVFGEEAIDGLQIQFFNDQAIHFDPIGLDVVGAYGRVDMRLGLHKVMIVMLEKDSNWLFAERYNREEPTYYEFNQENFEQLVTDFMESFNAN